MKSRQTFVIVLLVFLCLRSGVNANEAHICTADKLTSGITIWEDDSLEFFLAPRHPCFAQSDPRNAVCSAAIGY